MFQLPLPESKKRANKKWDEGNKERKQYLNKRSVARNFIKKSATNDDLDELESLIKYRKDNNI